MSTDFSWDRAVVNLDGDEALLKELAQVFIDEKDQMLGNIHQALLEQDAAGLKRSAHTLKGAVRVFGASKLTEICQHLEKLGEDETFTGAEEALMELSGAVQNLSRSLENILASTQS